MLTAVRFPGPPPPGLILPGDLGGVTCEVGDWAWAWADAEPVLPIETFVPVVGGGGGHPAWGVDHVVVGTPDLEATVERLVAVGGDDRRRGKTGRGQAAAFVLAGTLVEVIEVGSRTRLVGIAFETDDDLEAVAATWRSVGVEVTDPHPAVQPGRHIMSTRGAPVAVMTRRT